MYYGIRDGDPKQRIAGFFSLGISVFIATVIGLRNVFQQPGKYVPFKDIVRKTLLAYFGKLNKKYGSRGIEFYV